MQDLPMQYIPADAPPDAAAAAAAPAAAAAAAAQEESSKISCSSFEGDCVLRHSAEDTRNIMLRIQDLNVLT